MPKFCANLTWLFAELDPMERFAAAKDYGFEAVEMLQPYDLPVKDVMAKLARTGQIMTLINCPPPNYTGGQRGFAAVADMEVRFQRDFGRTLRYATALKAQFVHVMAGEAEGAGARALFIKNLQYAADFAPKQALTIEPLNPFDAPGYFLNDYGQARDILGEINRDNVHLQFDAYHVHRIHGDVLGMWDKLKHLVRHVQIAQAPKRDEPVGGPIDYPAFFAALDRDGYDGWVSCEYRPRVETGAGLKWLPC